MPRTGQIIPEWLHPHESVYINDNTTITDYANDNSGPVFLHVFASPSGRDRKLLYKNNISNFVNEFGLPNYRLYGQPLYNAYVCLSTGLATSQSMRITADDATLANMVLVAYYKVDAGKLKLKFECLSREGLREEDDFDAYIETLASDTPNEDGYKSLPIMKFWCRGRGVYGNDYRIRISRDKNANKDNNYMNYLIELLSTQNGFSKIENYNVCFYIDAIDPNTKFTMFMNDIIDDEEGKGSSTFNGALIYDNLNKIFGVYKEVYANNGYIPPVIKKVAKLPGTELPSVSVVYKLTANDGDKVKGSMWVYNADLAMFTEYGKQSAMVGKLPMIMPVDFGTDVIYWVNTTNHKVFSYDKHQFAVSTKTVEEKTTYEEAANNPGVDVLYKVTESQDSAHPNGYYEYIDGTLVSVAVYEGTVDAPVGTEFAAANVVYELTAIDGDKQSGTQWTLNADGTAYEQVLNIEKVAALPPTEVYEEGVVYELTAEEGNKPIGSQWIYDETAQGFVEYVEQGPSQPDPLLLTMETFDIFGYNRYTDSMDEFMEFDGGQEAIQVLSIEGVGLDNGSDGKLSEAGTYTVTEYDQEGIPHTHLLTESEREEALEAAYLKAFRGEFDKSILSKRRAPITMMLDANYSFNVKTEMVSLTKNRTDCVCHLDTGLIQNETDLENYGIRMNNFADRTISKDAGMFKTVDPITGKIIPVTITLWLSQKYPQHFDVYGNHVPLAGETYGTMSGFEKGSIRPIVDADDHELKEQLYTKYHMNYIEAIDETTYIRGTQNTSQEQTSDLSEENNMLVLLEIKRKIERLAAANRYHWADVDELRLFKEACEEVFSSYQGTKCKSLSINVDYSDWEKLRYIVHVYLEVVFRTFQKRAIIEIDVNPRA